MPRQCHSEWQGDDASCRAGEEKGHGHDMKIHLAHHPTDLHMKLSPRKYSDQSSLQSLKEEYEE